MALYIVEAKFRGSTEKGQRSYPAASIAMRTFKAYWSNRQTGSLARVMLV